MALRVHLYPSEEQAEKATVCVTGATGYVAGPIIKRLLVAGHTVHATVRNPDKQDGLVHLKALPGASERLKFFKADLLAAGSFDEAVQGCDCVIHTASPYLVSVPKGKEREMLIDPAVKGTTNVLEAVNKSPSVKRVVLTSSEAAVYGDPHERGMDHIFTEDDWNITATEIVLPYYYSKTLAERKAWEMADAQSRWDLVAMNPGAVFGPPLSSRADGTSISLMKDLLTGGFWPAAPPFGFGVVDVDDVAAAHVLAMVTKEAKGRYNLVVESFYFKGIADLLRDKYGKKYKLPKIGYVPKWALYVLGPVVGVGADMLKHSYGKLPRFDHSKVERELGIKFTDPKRTFNDMAASLIDLGIVKAR